MKGFLGTVAALSVFLLSVAAFLPEKAEAALQKVTYPFSGLTSNPADPNWRLLETYPSDMRMDANTFQMIRNSAVEPANGEFMKIRFYVPEEGRYDLRLTPYRFNILGGYTDILIDGQLLVSDFSFYSPTAVIPAEVVLAEQLYLTQGHHVLEFAGKKGVLWPTSGTYHLYLYLRNFQLVPLPALADVQLSADAQQIMAGQYVNANVAATMNDGSPADLRQASIQYGSDNPNVLRFVSATGLIEAVAQGTATMTATVYLDGVTRTGSRTIQVEPFHMTSDKTRSTIYTPAKVTNARANAASYDWARSIRDTAVAKADNYVALGWEFLWISVPPQTVPRSYAVNQPLGSPITGLEIDKWGNYPYVADPVNEPWKLTDPSSGYKFPTNDFGAYYASGLDERGIFRPELADRSLLVNELYPERGPTWGVDDGYGWYDENGNAYTFIAYYTHFYLWWGKTGIVQDAITSLRDAYLYTGDKRYAQAGIVLLDRIADVYPSLDLSKFDRKIFWHSDMNNAKGKAVGSIWETELVKHFISAYDAFFPAMDDITVMDDVIDFLSAKGQQYKLSFKNTVTGLRKNVEDGILRQVYPAVKNMSIFGNTGFHQSALAMAAVVHDTLPETREWLDFNFRTGEVLRNPLRLTGGNILNGLVNTVDRDGHGNEGAPSYNAGWLMTYLEAADILRGYDKYPEGDLYENVKFRKMFGAMHELMMLDRYTPSIGDSAYTGNPRLILYKDQMIRAFEVYRDPVYAQLAYFLNGNKLSSVHGDIFSGDPDAIRADIQAVIEEYGPYEADSTNLSGTGFAALRDGVRQSSQTGSGIRMLFPDLQVTVSSAVYRYFEASSTIQLEANDPGHSIAFAFPIETGGTYRVDFRPFRANSYGIYDVRINNEWVKQIDFFGSDKELETLAEMTLPAGTHVISFHNAGKSPSSSNYKMGVTELRLLDTSEANNPPDQEAEDTQRGLWMYYGTSRIHGHSDTLNLGMHAFGLDIAPDLGYPKYADAVDTHRHQWMINTISHNTVVVDQTKQQLQDGAQPKHYDGDGRVKLIDVEAPLVYPQTSMYRRTTAMIQANSEFSYAVDFFRVQGGTDHRYSFHSMEGEVAAYGLNLIPQNDGLGSPVGSYAGADVPFGPAAGITQGKGYTGSGFHWLKNVERDSQPQPQFSVDWNVRDTWNIYGQGAHAPTDTHLRLTMIGELDEAALADGLPPDNKPGNPEKIRYFIGKRSGANLNSLFTAVIEPYKGSRFIQSINSVVVRHGGVVIDSPDVRAVKVLLANGRTDYVVYSLDPDKEYEIDGKIRFRGFFGVYSEEGGEEIYGYVHDGSYIAPITATPFEAAVPRVTGTVVDFSRGLSVSNYIDVQMSVYGAYEQSLIGKWIFIDNDGVRNAAYEIKDIIPLGDSLYRLSTGDVTLVRSFADTSDFSQGYLYDVAVGRPFRIPLSSERILAPPVTNSPATIAGMSGLVNRYTESRDIQSVLAGQLIYRLDIIGLLLTQGQQETAHMYLDDFLAYIRDPSVLQQGLISAVAAEALQQYAERLTGDWSD
ncbi:FIMAH domain-containing protein [Paenibacillus oceani]|uniref:Heparinase II/III family protein n=1 Tax=Paenibacillus oceani TaxID=2772510 RepID=A0A927C8R8_9BACL|nr:heparinase II/III family protein [Paenibacillus oceani]MBD2863504.1 heparinase II/III family protein [Paenibacillus oceani]